MGTGMLDDVPPEQVEPILFEVELALHFDTGLAHEGRKLGRHGMGKVHNFGEAARIRCTRWDRRRGKSSRGRTFEETASTQGCPDFRFTPGDAHAFSRPI